MRIIERNTRKENGCWLWVGSILDKDGYGLIQYEGKLWRAHRLSFLLHNGSLGDEHVLHTCDVRRCCNPEHLYQGTQRDNWQDAIDRGRTNTGEKHWASKLTEAQVKEILFKLALGIDRSSIAKEYSVSVGCISNIKYGTRWKHLTKVST